MYRRSHSKEDPMPELPCPFLDGWKASDPDATVAAKDLVDHLTDKHVNVPIATSDQLEDTSTNS